MGSRRRGSASSTLLKKKMELNLPLLILLATGVLGQTPDPPVCDPACEESWEYVDFLKKEVSEKVAAILTNFKTTQDGDKAVEETMTKVMDIREKILARIKDLRKGDTAVCFGHNVKQDEKLSDFRMNVMQILLELVKTDAASIESLRKIGADLVKFRGVISAEVMRILMLDAPCGEKTVINTDCPKCDAVQQVKETLEKLKECASAKADDPADPAGGAAPAAPAGGADPADGAAACMPPNMYNMDLILANEELDKSIAKLYNDIIKSTDDTEREEHVSMLTMLKEVREQIDEHITNLLEEEDDAKIKKYVTSTMRGFINGISTKYQDCFEKNQCAGGPQCDSCGAEKVDEMRDKMREYKSYLDSQREEDDKKESIRDDLINYINKINEEARKILTDKVNSDTGVLADCEREQKEVIDECKGPMWMLVNTTIFATYESVVEMVDIMDSELKRKRSKYCKSDSDPPPPTSTCQWEEYEETRNYLIKVDEVIQTGLFKEADKKTALIGFVDIQAMFDRRVKKLFEDDLRCPPELENIKKTYMPILSRCMAKFMRPSLDFADLNRFERISCIKELRNELEARTAELLQFELEESLNVINGDQTTEST